MKIKDKRVLALYLMVICLVILGVTYALQLVNVQLDAATAIVKVDDNVTWPSTFDATNLDFRPILDSEVETSTDNVIKTEFVVGADDENTATDKVIYL